VWHQTIKFWDWCYHIDKPVAALLLVHVMTAEDPLKESSSWLSIFCRHHGAAQLKIKVSVRLEKTATETHKMLENVYRNESLCHTCVFKWFKRFREVWQPWRWSKESATVNFSKSINSCRTSYSGGQRQPIIPKLITINYTLIRRQLVRFFVKILERGRSALSSFHTFSQRSNISIESQLVKLHPHLSDQSTLSQLHLWGNQSWIFQNNPETKHQSMEWRIKSSSRFQKLVQN
jgi:hypothetical protein